MKGKKYHICGKLNESWISVVYMSFDDPCEAKDFWKTNYKFIPEVKKTLYSEFAIVEIVSVKTVIETL